MAAPAIGPNPVLAGPFTSGSSRARITGIDMVRGIAMALMVAVHFVHWREGEGALYTAAELTRGRAMPLFMLLGGVGVTLMISRSSTPIRNLVIRSVMLMALGLYLTENIERLAIVLQSYSLFFIVAIALWKLPSSTLLALVPTIIAVGSVTYQIVGEPRVNTEYDTLLSIDGIESLIFDGFYPFFPTAAFFVFGMWLGRLDLRSDRIASMLLAGGSAIGVGLWVGVSQLLANSSIRVDFGGNGGDGQFHLSRLLDIQGHSAMPAWTISALGTSTALLGFSLLVARRAESAFRPLILVGSMSLSFYVFQAWVTNIVPPTAETGVVTEWAYAIGVYVVFVVFAMLWKMKFRSGPLEAILRIGSGPSLPRDDPPRG